MDPSLDIRDIRQRLHMALVGRNIEIHRTIGSTNARAVELARQGEPEGLIILAEEQTAGRGRLGRRWYAPAGSSLLMSLLFRPTLDVHQAQRITMLCSLAALDAISHVGHLQAAVKWPNDLLIGDRKVGGMLTELAMAGERLAYVVVGLGLNVNLDAAALPEALTPATSLRQETGASVSRADLLVFFLQAADRRYSRLCAGESPHEEWRLHLATLGRTVQVGTREGVIEGRAVDVDADGALLIESADGIVRRVLAGDVTLRGHALPASDSQV